MPGSRAVHGAEDVTGLWNNRSERNSRYYYSSGSVNGSGRIRYGTPLWRERSERCCRSGERAWPSGPPSVEIVLENVPSGRAERQSGGHRRRAPTRTTTKDTPGIRHRTTCSRGRRTWAV